MDAQLADVVAQLKRYDAEIILLSGAVFAGLAVWTTLSSKVLQNGLGLTPYVQFAYNNFIKPHDAKAGEGQQSALESFYARQVGHQRAVHVNVYQLSFSTGRYLRHYPQTAPLWT